MMANVRGRWLPLVMSYMAGGGAGRSGVKAATEAVLFKGGNSPVVFPRANLRPGGFREASWNNKEKPAQLIDSFNSVYG